MRGLFFYTYSNPIGITGVVLILFGYLMLQLHQMSPHGLTYTLMNTMGSSLILISLCYHLNIASMVIEVAWLLISLFGFIQALYRKCCRP